MGTYPQQFSLRPGHPDFLDLPWDTPLADWGGRCARLEDVPHGTSRHPVWFVNYGGVLYALKELPAGVALREYEALHRLEEAHLPAVVPVGHAQTETHQGAASVLITRSEISWRP